MLAGLVSVLVQTPLPDLRIFRSYATVSNSLQQFPFEAWKEYVLIYLIIAIQNDSLLLLI